MGPKTKFRCSIITKLEFRILKIGLKHFLSTERVSANNFLCNDCCCLILFKLCSHSSKDTSVWCSERALHYLSANIGNMGRRQGAKLRYKLNSTTELLKFTVYLRFFLVRMGISSRWLGLSKIPVNHKSCIHLYKVLFKLVPWNCVQFSLQYEIICRYACCTTECKHGPEFRSNVLHQNQYSKSFSLTEQVLWLRVVSIFRLPQGCELLTD